MKKELNKWQFVLHLKDDPCCLPKHKRVFRFGIFNMERFPGEGVAFGKECYKGFILKWRFTHPLVLLERYLVRKGY